MGSQVEDHCSSEDGRWFKCPVCHTKLAPVLIYKGRTVIWLEALSIMGPIYRAELRCPFCGESHRFESRPVP